MGLKYNSLKVQRGSYYRHCRGLLKAALLSLSVLFPGYATDAWSFGATHQVGANEEHQRITQAALGCSSRFTSTPVQPCFQYDTLSNLAGFGPPAFGAFPAVAAPDNLIMHGWGGPEWWHCDNGDYYNNYITTYPQTRAAATQKLLDCRLWAQRMLGDGLVGNKQYCNGARSWLCTGVAATVHKMLNGKGNVDIVQPPAFTATRGCSFNGAHGRIKCDVLQQFGYALHAIQDFYSHSNFADLSRYTTPITWQNPPGLGFTTLPKFWDMTLANGDPSLIPDIWMNLSSGCYPDGGCENAQRTSHAILNKDKSDIDPLTGTVTNPRTPRGQYLGSYATNAQLVVTMAIRQTRQAWLDLQQLIIQKEGSARAAKIICAIASDTPNRCGKSSAASVPQEEFSDPDKVAPYDWVFREYQAEEDNLQALRNGSLTQTVAIGPSGVVGITNPTTLSCGDMTVDAHEVIPDLGPLTAFDLTVAGTSCKHALKLLKRFHHFNASGRAKGSVPAPKIQCVTMATNPDPNSNNARIVCKNQDESIEMSFLPTCPGHEGDCGM